MDDKIRLALEILGAGDVKELNAQLRQMRGAFAESTQAAAKVEADTYELADAYEVLAHSEQGVFTSAVMVGQAMRKAADDADPVAHAMAELAAASDREAVAVGKSAAAHKKAGAAAKEHSSKQSKLQQTITSASYAFQDFTSTSGDLGAKLNSISNNIPQLLVGMGGIGVALSGVFTAGVAVYRNWDQIAALWETRNPFPKAAGDVEGLKRELERAKDEMEAFEKAGTGNARQLERYNELRAKTAEIEAKIADQQERQARLKKFLEGKTEADQDRAQAYQGATEGRGQEYLDKIKEALRKSAEQQIEGERFAMQSRVQAYLMQDHSYDEQQEFMAEQARRFQDYAKSLRSNDWGERAKELNDRLLLGEERAGKILERLMSETGVYFDGLGKRMRERTKEGKEEKEFDEEARKVFAGLADKEKKEAKDFDENARKVHAALADKGKKAGNKAGNAAGKDEAKDLATEAKVNEGAIDAEVKKINSVVGKTYQARFEQAMAENAARAAQGLPSMNPKALEGRLRSQMVARLKGRGATEQGANLAARGIAVAGKDDLGRRAADASANGLNLAQSTLMIQRQLIDEYQRMSLVQQQLTAMARDNARRLQSAQRNARKR